MTTQGGCVLCLLCGFFLASVPGARADDASSAPSAPDAPTQEQGSAPPPPGTDAPAAKADAPLSSTFLDRIVLENGSFWEGHIVSEDREAVVLEQISAQGGVSRLRFPRHQVASVERGRDRAETPPGMERIREEWFFLWSGGEVVGWRNLRLLRICTANLQGWRLDEEMFQFARGRHLPAVRTRLVEVTDLIFRPLLIDFREATEGAQDPEDRFERRVSGPVRGGIWERYTASDAGAERSEVPLPPRARGRLGFREHLIRHERRVGLEQAQVLDPVQGGLVEVHAGYVSLDEVPDGGGEILWRQDHHERRLRVGRGGRALEEEIAAGLLARPSTEKQALAAAAQSAQGAPEGSEEVRLPLPGLTFRLPGPLWTWKPDPPGKEARRHRRLGRLFADHWLADVRIEWHPDASTTAPRQEDAEAWVLDRLRAVAPDLRILGSRRPLPHLAGSWRIDLESTLNGDIVRTVVVVVDRAPGRALFLCACPRSAWFNAEVAFDRFIDSLDLL